VTAAYDGYTTARAAADIAAQAVAVARESYRVQQSRYRAGATTILDLLKAQADLDDAESGLSRQGTRRAWPSPGSRQSSAAGSFPKRNSGDRHDQDT